MIPKWKREQAEKRYQKQKRIIIIFSGGVLFLLILSLIFRIYSGFKQSKTRLWERVNFLINLSEPAIVSFSSSKRAFLLKLPVEREIRLTRGYGRYQIKAVYGLGELEGKGVDLLEESIQEYFALPVFGSIGFDREVGCDLENKSCLQKQILKGLLGQLKTSFWPGDLVYLWWQLFRLPEYNYERQVIEETDCLTPEGETEIRCLDLIVGQVFSDGRVVSEDLAISVFNATGFPGLGAQASRIITNLGGRVVSVGNSDFETKVVFKAKKEITQTYTFKLLKEVFQGEWQEGVVDQGRAEIGIYLGIDYWKKLNEKW